MSKARLLFAASEVYPFAKTGGLADVAHSLPRALNREYEVCVVMPLYRTVDRKRFGIVVLDERFDITMGEIDYSVELYGCEYEGINYRFIYSPLLCEREFLYGPPESGYEDNALRFGIFNYAIMKMLKQQIYAIAHLNDWQSALVPLMVKEDDTITTKTLYTIHNLSYQGSFDASVLKELGINEACFTIDGLEFYGQVNFMKAGIAYADRVSTVSPTYAKEILTPEFGCGLEGFLQHHRQKLVGIVNGIDTEHFSPSTDKALIEPYDTLSGKVLNKTAYLKQTGLKGVKKPLFVFIGRFTWQKGMDLLIETLPKIASLECNIAILGEGEVRYREALKSIADIHKNIYLEFGYDEALSHRMYAAADFLIMPSLFEPCGLTQMIAMSYGTLPVVHHIGGLADTVISVEKYDSKSASGYGVAFTRPTVRSFGNAVYHAVMLYGDKRRYNLIAKHNMKCDFSWQESARTYESLYRQMILPHEKR